MLLREQTERRLQQLVALSEIDLAIISSSDMVFSLGVLLLQVLEQLKVDAADVWLFNPASQALEFVSGRGFEPWLSIMQNHCISEKVMQVRLRSNGG